MAKLATKKVTAPETRKSLVVNACYKKNLDAMLKTLASSALVKAQEISQKKTKSNPTPIFNSF